MNDTDRVRREFLVRLLGAGFFSLSPALGIRSVNAMSRLPDELPPGRSIYRLEGKVFINRLPADEQTSISPGDVIETGAKSQVIFIVNRDAFILRENSRLELEPDGEGLLLESLRLLTGKLLSVMEKRGEKQKLNFFTTTATIGIRGTGIYLESEPEKTYVCTCYGKTELRASADPAQTELLETRYHDAPRYIYMTPKGGRLISEAPVINHTDAELGLVEALVGRTVPFDPTSTGGNYGRRY